MLLLACFSISSYYVPVIVLSIFFLHNKIFQQSELQVTFPFQPEENTAIWATISGNAILSHSVHEYSESESGTGIRLTQSVLTCTAKTNTQKDLNNW